MKYEEIEVGMQVRLVNPAVFWPSDRTRFKGQVGRVTKLEDCIGIRRDKDGYGVHVLFPDGVTCNLRPSQLERPYKVGQMVKLQGKLRANKSDSDGCLSMELPSGIVQWFKPSDIVEIVSEPEPEPVLVPEFKIGDYVRVLANPVGLENWSVQKEAIGTCGVVSGLSLDQYIEVTLPEEYPGEWYFAPSSLEIAKPLYKEGDKVKIVGGSKEGYNDGFRGVIGTIETVWGQMPGRLSMEIVEKYPQAFTYKVKMDTGRALNFLEVELAPVEKPVKKETKEEKFPVGSRVRIVRPDDPRKIMGRTDGCVGLSGEVIERTPHSRRVQFDAPEKAPGKAPYLWLYLEQLEPENLIEMEQASKWKFKKGDYVRFISEPKYSLVEGAVTGLWGRVRDVEDEDYCGLLPYRIVCRTPYAKGKHFWWCEEECLEKIEVPGK